MLTKVSGASRLGIIIPTQDRPECIRFFLESCVQDLQRFPIDLILYDSSSDNQTENIATFFQQHGGGHIYYARYTPQGDPRSLDHKVFSACKMFCNHYDYLWFTSDGTVPRIAELFGTLCRLMNQDAELIVLDKQDGVSMKFTRYTDSRGLLCDCGWFMTRMNATVISTALVQQAVETYPVLPDKNFWLWLPFAYYYLLSDRAIQVIRLSDRGIYDVNPNRVDSFWKTEGNALWQWSCVWVDAVEALPPWYDPVKSAVLLSHDAHTHLFSLKSLISMREWNCITLPQISSCRSALKKVTTTPLWCFYIVAALVRPVVVKKLKQIYHHLHRGV